MEEDWNFSVEVEAVLQISKDNVIFSQHEKKLNAAFGPVARRYTHKKLASDRLSIINMDTWDGKSKISPRIMMDVNDMSTEGRICRKRAMLELERQFFGNDGEEIFEDMMTVNMPEMKLTCREEVRLVLDKQTVGREVVLDREQWKHATMIYKTAYINFYVSQKMFERKKDRERAKEYVVAGTLTLTSNLKEPTAEGNAIYDLFSDDESVEDKADGGGMTGQLSEEQHQVVDRMAANTDAKNALKQWLAWEPDWKTIYSSANLSSNATANLHPFDDLMNLDMYDLMNAASDYNNLHDNVFGLIIMMGKNSPYQLGALNAQSFVERMNSHGNLIVDKNRMCLDDDTIDKLVVLKTNSGYMENTRDQCAVIKNLKLSII